MRGHAKFAAALLVLGLLAIVAWRIGAPLIKESAQTAITDAGELKATIAIAVDGWVGYFPLCSPEMKKRMRREGYGLQCIDDSANYAERFRKLDNNDYDFAVATVDSYVLVGARYGYPGAIVAVIDESKGGDAIVARQSVVASLEELKSKDDIRVAYTPASPSHHLLKSVAAHFEVPAFKDGNLHYLAEGSEDAYRALRDQKADVAVLWEPDVSRALADDDFVRLLGTEDTQRLIVDILVASRRVARDENALVMTLLKHYFQTLKHYSDNRAALEEDLSDYVNLSPQQVRPLLAGVRWANLSENAEVWYGAGTSGFSQQALVGSIESAVSILLDHGDFDEHPLPNRDPFRLLSSQYIAELYQLFGQTGAWAGRQAGAAGELQFTALSDDQWGRLKEVGALKARRIAFASGTSNLTEEGRRKIDELIKDLSHYPGFRVEVRGHTGVRGDPQVNLALSRERARAVLDYMLTTHEVERNRVRAIGFGGERPLARKPNESSRAYSYRLPRVELVLVRETI